MTSKGDDYSRKTHSEEIRHQPMLIDFWIRMLALAELAIVCVGVAVYFSVNDRMIFATALHVILVLFGSGMGIVLVLARSRRRMRTFWAAFIALLVATCLAALV